MTPGLEEIRKAARRIAPYIHHTPVITNASINRQMDCEIFFKCENFQKAGAFKSRGACNAIFSLTDEEVERGVATHSSGNHAQALARAASLRDCPAYIVMPSTSSKVKVNAVKEYGGRITFCEPNLASRESTLEEVIKETGATEIHPYNDYRIITAQATAALELMEEIDGFDIIMAPVGGGGLLSGTLLTVKNLDPSVKVIAGEPEGASDAFRSFQSGKFIPSENPDTIADGLLTSLGTLTFPIVMANVDDILLADDETIKCAMRMIWERMKIIVEPSAAVPLAAIMKNPERFKKKRTGVILSGGNIDLDHIPWIKK